MQNPPKAVRSASRAALAVALLSTALHAAASTPPASVAPTPPRPVGSIATTLSLPAPTEYVDRVMSDTDQLDSSERKIEPYNAAGWPRGVSLQLSRNLRTNRTTSSTFGGSTELRNETTSIDLNAFLDTPNYGTLSLQALMLGGGSVKTLSSWSVRQVGLPFDGGWSADNAFGVTTLLAPELARRSSRLPLPIPQVQGASTQWRNQWRDGNLTAGASIGEPGRFVGFPQSRFDGTGGKIVSLFAQTTYAPWTFAAAVAQGDGIILNTNALAQTTSGSLITTAPRGNPVSVYLAAAQAMGAVSWQLNAIGSRMVNDTSLGILLDTQWRHDWQSHQLSVFRLEPSLSWLDRALPSDLQGLAYRHSYTAPRWDTSANLELFRSVSGNTPQGYFGNAALRRQVSARLSLGGGFASRKYGGTSNSAFVFTQWLNPLGASRLQLDVSNSALAGSRQSLTAEQTLFDEGALSLSTTLSVERLSLRSGTSGGGSQRAVTPGLNSRLLITDNLSLQANVLYRNIVGTGGATSNSNMALNIGFDWNIGSGWSLNALIYENRGVIRDVIVAESPLAPAVINTIKPNDRGVFIGVRYGASAGTPVAPIGGKPGSGFGRLEGVVFFDGNNNAIRDASEGGIPNVVVVLNGRFSTRADANGVFAFDAVVAGVHTLSVVPDDLPLPWTVDPEHRIQAEVNTRQTTRISIGAKKLQ